MRLRAQSRLENERKGPTPTQLSAAYGVCRSISRAAARNFYYSFLALPREKRDAICAVYAFMRHADDISDDPAMGVEEKRARLADWLEQMQRVSAGAPTDDPVLMAVADARYRYAIPPALLESLVEGTAMDLREPEVSAPQQAGDVTSQSAAPAHAGLVATAVGAPPLVVAYATFADLYDYCYHVAAVVGLICICIFGYHDPSAEPLAEHCGIAFQLTNMIRDVKEDAAMGRVYLPQEDLQRFGCDPAELRQPSPQVAEHYRPLLEFEAQRARDFYRAAEELLDLIDDDSRPALWVLVTIYQRLLDKIAARNYDVFGEKVRLSALEKANVLAKGLWMRVV